MKKFVSIVILSLMVSSFSFAADKKESGAGFTQEKAQMIIENKYPGAKVLSSKADTLQGASVWVVTFTRTGGNVSEKAAVDATTGKVTKL